MPIIFFRLPGFFDDDEDVEVEEKGEGAASADDETKQLGSKSAAHPRSITLIPSLSRQLHRLRPSMEAVESDSAEETTGNSSSSSACPSLSRKATSLAAVPVPVVLLRLIILSPPEKEGRLIGGQADSIAATSEASLQSLEGRRWSDEEGGAAAGAGHAAAAAAAAVAAFVIGEELLLEGGDDDFASSMTFSGFRSLWTTPTL